MAADPWKQLLHMTTQMTVKDGPSTTTEVPKELDPENLEFLQKALIGEQNQPKGPSMIEIFFQLGLKSPQELMKDEKMMDRAKDLAEQLEDFFIMGDSAEQFSTEEGLKALENFTCSPDSELQLLYLRLIPLIAENRLQFQEILAKSQIFPKYLDQISDFSHFKPSTLNGLIAAISAICRGCEGAWHRFFELKADLKVLKLVENAKDDLVGGKAAHMLWSIYNTIVIDNPTILHRKEMEKTIILSYIGLVNRQIQMEERFDENGKENTVYTFVEETKHKIVNLILKFPPADHKKPSDPVYQSIKKCICDRNLGCVPIPTTEDSEDVTSSESSTLSAKERKNALFKARQKKGYDKEAEEKPVKPKPAKKEEKGAEPVIQDPVAAHYSIPMKYTVAEAKEISKREK